MGQRNYPLTEGQVVAALLLLGFVYKDCRGSHKNYVATIRGKYRKVTVDGHLDPFSQTLISSMANQAGISKKELYAAVEGVVPSDLVRQSPA